MLNLRFWVGDIVARVKGIDKVFMKQFCLMRNLLWHISGGQFLTDSKCIF